MKLQNISIVCGTNKSKKVVLAFYNCFRKTELNCDKENHVNFKYM